MDPEALFLRFRATRDPELLGAVFDRCADDLFGVAMHLCRDTATAEDVVQSTFLVAMERTHRFRDGRPLRPWLLGILHREVGRARRRARVPDPARLERDPVPPPSQWLADREVADAVREALGRVPQPYREVVELHLVQSLPSRGIAVRLQRSPGAVRTQLWRGLERLRELLPRSLALGAVPMADVGPSIGVVRERVVAAARTHALTASTAVVVGGALLMKKVVAVVAVLVASLALGSWWAAADDAAPSRAEVAEQVAAPRSVADPSPDSGRAERTASPPPLRTSSIASSAGPVDAAPDLPPQPTALAILVVDGAGDPVVDADVSLRGVTRVGESDVPMSGDPKASSRTDGGGRCRLAIESGMAAVSARKVGVGWTGEVRVPRQHGDAPMPLVLLPTARIRGVVKGVAGEPLAGAVVRGFDRSFDHRRFGELSLLHSDENGGFACEVLSGTEHEWFAGAAGVYTEKSFTGELAPDTVREIVLQVPGAFAIDGQLVDGDDRPLAGEVYAFLDDTSTRRVACGADGRFTIRLAAPGSVRLVGGIEGQTSVWTAVSLDTTTPRCTVTLRTTPFVPVGGRVVDENAAPLPGVHVGLAYALERDALEEVRTGLHGILPRGPTAADGTFAFLAPAGYRYRVVCQAIPGSRELWVRSAEFAAPAGGLSIVVREADRQGFRIAGSCVVDASGAPVPRFTIGRITDEGRGTLSYDDSIGVGENGAFDVGPLQTGQRCSFEFRADGYARCIVGPFTTTARVQRVDVRLLAFGRVRVRVLRSDGTPAVKVFVGLQHGNDEAVFGRAWQGETDASGCIEFDEVEPVPFKVHARAAVETGGAAVADLVVAPGQTAECHLVLRR